MASLEPDSTEIRLRLAAEEVDVLVSLAEGLAQHLESAPDPGAAAADEVLERLAPRASYGDEQVDAELRGMLHADLLSARMLRLRDLAQLLGDRAGADGAFDSPLSRDASMRMVEALNDLRIGLAATVGYEHVAAEAERSLADPAGAEERSDALRLLDALGWLQGGLIEFIDRGTDQPD